MPSGGEACLPASQEGKMAKGIRKDGSVAPRERINIVYKPATDGAEEEVELPMRFLVMGDFTGREEETPIEEREPINVDKDNFNEVLAAQDVGVDVNVPNKLSDEESDELGVSLKFKHINDFAPDSITQQVPELKALTELRDALSALKGPLGNLPKFRKRLEAILDDPEAQKRLLKELESKDDE
jgi:type VI secretion system protein ImpB